MSFPLICITDNTPEMAAVKVGNAPANFTALSAPSTKTVARLTKNFGISDFIKSVLNFWNAESS